MNSIIIKMTRDKYNFRFKQYEGMFFHADINEESEVVRYKITKDEKGLELKEFGNTHVKDDMLYIPQIEVYIPLNSLK
ncbi:hypothetical protein [Romboutsia weinsteinii]|uniref:hypothetical protein n=1 Tax=Romboutsia weinsteinii TaxID=2020949 RepID=UPI001FB10C5E|nr:hypothetical protein [Romboutsia weinsteinii]